MKRWDTLAVLVILGLGALLILPFIRGEKAFYPFHTGVVSPWDTRSPDWTRDEPHNFNAGDKHTIIYPDLTFTRHEFDEGHIPLWNPRNFAGLPHEANPLTGVFYPPTGLFAFGDILDRFAWSMALHLVLAALFAYMFLRSLGLRPLASLFGGMAFAFCGWIGVHLHHAYFVQAMVWLPLILFCIEVLLRRRHRWALMLLSVAVACMWLGAFPQTAVINTYVVAAYALVGLIRTGRRRGWKPAARLAGSITGFAALGLLIAMIQLAPTLEFTTTTGHQNLSVEHLRADALRPVTLIHLLVPDFFGNPAEQKGALEQENFFAWWLLADGQANGRISNNYSERTFYPGIVVLVLALLSLLIARTRAVLFFAGGTALGIAIALGGPLTSIVIHVPGWNFGSLMRFTQIAALGFPVMAAAGLDALIHTTSVRRLTSARWALRGLLVPLFLLAVTVLALWVAPDWTTTKVQDRLDRWGVSEKLGVTDTPVELRRRIFRNQFIGPEEDGQPDRSLRKKLTILLCLSIASWVLLILLAERRGARPAVVAGLFALLLADLGAFDWKYNRPVKREGLFATSAPGIDYLRNHQKDTRFIRWDPASSAGFFLPNSPLAVGLNDAQGFRSLTPLSYLEFLRTLEPNPAEIGLPNLKNLKSLTSPQLDVLRVKHVISRSPIANSPLSQVYPLPDLEGPADMYIYENADILPRAWFVHDVHVLPPEATLEEFTEIARSETTSRPFADQVWLEELRLGMRSRYPRPEAPQTVSIAEGESGSPIDHPTRTVFDVVSDVDALMVVSCQFDPGWKAFARREGKRRKKLPVLKADHCLIAVPVPAGTSRVELVYEPTSFQWGGLISGISLCFLLLVPLIPRFATPRRERSSDP